MLKKLLYLTLSLLLFLSCFSCSKKQEEKAIQFVDAEFGNVVAEAFSKDVSELTLQDLSNVEGVDIRYYSKYLSDTNSYKKVWSVSVTTKGYRNVYDYYFSADSSERENLPKPADYRFTTELQSFNGYSDLNKFPAIKELTIDSEYDIIKINPLQYITGLISIETLSVYNFAVPDLKPLTLFPNIKNLSIGLNPKNLEPDEKIDFITDISPLKQLKNLETLSLMGTAVSDLSPLVSLQNLKQLACTMSSLTNISPVARMTSLESVDFYYNAIENIEPLVNLPNLQYIRLDYNYISDVTPFANLDPDKIKYITLEMNAISDPSPMKHLGENKVYVGYDLYWD